MSQYSTYITTSQAASLIPNDVVVPFHTLESCVALNQHLKPLKQWFNKTEEARNLTTLHPIATRKMCNIKGEKYTETKTLNNLWKKN